MSRFLYYISAADDSCHVGNDGRFTDDEDDCKVFLSHDKAQIARQKVEERTGIELAVRCYIGEVREYREEDCYTEAYL